MNAEVKNREFELLSEIAQDSLVTQASLSVRLGMAVGSVNWYIKRLINRGYIKVSRLNRTRLKYDLTREGVMALKRRALQYAMDSLGVYRDFRMKAKKLVVELASLGISRVFLEGNDEIMDIFRLTCIECGISLDSTPFHVIVGMDDQQYTVRLHDSAGMAGISRGDQ